ncbi:DUF1566 domain-containing protein [Pseudoalteromonas elyakovii]|nr:DUF1566 domain-containing protein [Pseudoalteromonas elyakovii]
MRLVPLTLVALTTLTACGGGGGSSDSNPVAATVNAGSDQQIIEKSEFTVSAQGSPADGTFTWERVSGPALEGFPAEGAEQTITAPDIKLDSELVLKVNYQTDGQLVSDQVSIFITSNNQLPVAVITQTAPEELPSQYSDVITLSGEESADIDENGSVDSYLWTQLDGPDLTADSYNNQTISFTHPLLESNTAMTWRLTVTDDEGGSASTEASFTLNKTVEVIIADAGEDQQVIEFDTVTLDASNSEIVTATKSCFWEQLTGETVTLANQNQNQNQCITTFVAPDVDTDSELSFEVTVTDSKSRSDTDTVIIDISPKPLGLINDTGMSDCYNNSQIIDCDSEDFPSQDADVGRDSVVNQLDKVGQGDLAFDFTKMNEYAKELPDDATSFSCVRDNVTGLIWEVKASDTSDERASINQYTWYLNGTTGVQTGSVKGAANSSCNNSTDCGLQTYIDYVNNSDLCNGTNWRVPTYTELLGLLDYAKQGESTLLNSDFFPNQPSDTQLSSDSSSFMPYWTSQTAADGTSLSQAYIIDMSSANDLAYPKSNTAFVRLVRTPGE